MKIYISIKTFFKGIKNNFIMYIVTLLLLPLFLAGFMGAITDGMFKNPADIEKFNVNIVDKNNTAYSENLKNYIKNDLNGLVNIVKNENDSNIEILIPGDYSSNVESKTPSNIYIKEIDDKNRNKSTIISGVLDNYHEMLYLNKVKAADNNNFKQIFTKKALATEYIKPDIMPNSYEFYALSLLGFLVIMMIMSNAVSAHLDQYTGLYKRTYSLPVSRVELLFHNTLSIFLYSFIFLTLYIMFYRFLGITFKGNFAVIIWLSAVASIFVAALSNFISSVFPKKIGTVFTYLLLVLEVVFGGMLNGFSDSLIDKFSNLSPTYLINEMFSNFNLYNNYANISTTVNTCIIVSLVLIVLTVVKEKFSWREI
ncbi:ABC transporter permease [Metaclostridioides mangenotii]|uniref:ABC-2 type transport system permease protein n=1 Tax=Metaclostridioides mangenotii TaxID=1540 RepID=A0ABS4E9B1_9FIRM|nr:ABC transporter permease [Clostridioides mangenotii]MBP1854535.1 ABC-2 type transport system permease protein [Clostridioides mangenotii]